MREIKSIRIRNRKYLNYINLDIKITLYDDDKDMIVDSDNKSMQPLFYKKSGLYSNYTNDEFIKDFINSNEKILNASYEIIQDPWIEKAPLWRSYGFDPYYLNNGATILITWMSSDGFVEGGRKYSDDDGNEINVLSNIIKTVNIISKDDSPMHFTKNNDIELKSSGESMQWGLVTDKNILKQIIEKWNNKILQYGLDLCSPDNQSCLIIEYKSPLLTTPESVTQYATSSQINQLPKIKMNVVIPDGIIKVKNDLSLKVYIGETNKNVDDYIYNTDDEDISQYLESDFEGLSEEEFNIQEEVSSGQLDSDANLVAPGEPVDMKQFSSFDELLILAGKCARELGKNPKVKYENLRINYKKGVHGLCPQGTLSVLYALTGIKKLVMMSGNANDYCSTGRNNFPSTHYNSRMKISREPYFSQPSQWQVGDIIAVDYIGRPYGHIQIWTGYKWVSDFTQNKLQINHVDFNTIGLHRLNSNGLLAVSKQRSINV